MRSDRRVASQEAAEVERADTVVLVEGLDVARLREVVALGLLDLLVADVVAIRRLDAPLFALGHAGPPGRSISPRPPRTRIRPRKRGRETPSAGSSGRGRAAVRGARRDARVLHGAAGLPRRGDLPGGRARGRGRRGARAAHSPRARRGRRVGRRCVCVPATRPRLPAALRELVAPNGTRVELAPSNPPLRLPPLRPSFVLTRAQRRLGVGRAGRAGMRYRDLIPDRQGGRFIASHDPDSRGRAGAGLRPLPPRALPDDLLPPRLGARRVRGPGPAVRARRPATRCCSRPRSGTACSSARPGSR